MFQTPKQELLGHLFFLKGKVTSKLELPTWALNTFTHLGKTHSIVVAICFFFFFFAHLYLYLLAVLSGSEAEETHAHTQPGRPAERIESVLGLLPSWLTWPAGREQVALLNKGGLARLHSWVGVCGRSGGVVTGDRTGQERGGVGAEEGSRVLSLCFALHVSHSASVHPLVKTPDV